MRPHGHARSLGSASPERAGRAHRRRQHQPYAPNIVYRGFTASPLQSSAQGLAAYVDGARFHLPFGDTVDLLLIPEIAIADVTIRDSSPVFGLNALGGALVVATKTGRTAPGVSAMLAGGSYGEVTSAAEAAITGGPFSA